MIRKGIIRKSKPATLRKRGTKKHPYLVEMGIKIKAARKSKNVSQRILADWCETDQSTIGRIEVGLFNSSILTLKRIADVLKVDVKDFI
jgi:predicted transcriptional regulator